MADGAPNRVDDKNIFPAEPPSASGFLAGGEGAVVLEPANRGEDIFGAVGNLAPGEKAEIVVDDGFWGGDSTKDEDSPLKTGALFFAGGASALSIFISGRRGGRGSEPALLKTGGSFFAGGALFSAGDASALLIFISGRGEGSSFPAATSAFFEEIPPSLEISAALFAFSGELFASGAEKPKVLESEWRRSAIFWLMAIR